MKIKPIHILAYTFWLNFLVLYWLLLLNIVAMDVKSVSMLIFFFLLSILTSAVAMEKKGGLVNDR